MENITSIKIKSKQKVLNENSNKYKIFMIIIDLKRVESKIYFEFWNVKGTSVFSLYICYVKSLWMGMGRRNKMKYKTKQKLLQIRLDHIPVKTLIKI